MFSKLFKSGSKCFSWHKHFLKFPIKNLLLWDFLAVQWSRFYASNTGGAGSISGHLSSWDLLPPALHLLPVIPCLFSLASPASWITLISSPFLITLHACRHQPGSCVQPPAQISSLHTPPLHSSLLHQIYPSSRLGHTQRLSWCLRHSLRWELEHCLAHSLGNMSTARLSSPSYSFRSSQDPTLSWFPSHPCGSSLIPSVGIFKD